MYCEVRFCDANIIKRRNTDLILLSASVLYCRQYADAWNRVYTFMVPRIIIEISSIGVVRDFLFFVLKRLRVVEISPLDSDARREAIGKFTKHGLCDCRTIFSR